MAPVAPWLRHRTILNGWDRRTSVIQFEHVDTNNSSVSAPLNATKMPVMKGIRALADTDGRAFIFIFYL